jgi:flagellar protein FliO/FliZ
VTTALFLRTSVSLAIVLGLLALIAWALRRGGFATRRFGARAVIAIETAVPLGERRSLVIVAVEGRRLLLGLAPGSVSLLTNLAAPRSGESAS